MQAGKEQFWRPLHYLRHHVALLIIYLAMPKLELCSMHLWAPCKPTIYPCHVMIMCITCLLIMSYHSWTYLILRPTISITSYVLVLRFFYEYKLIQFLIGLHSHSPYLELTWVLLFECFISREIWIGFHLPPNVAQRVHKWWTRPCGWNDHTTYILIKHKEVTNGEPGIVV